jgi:hypothetical protein
MENETPTAPSAEESAPTSMSLNDALGVLNAQDEPQEQPEPETAAEPEAPAGEPEVEEAETAEGDEPEAKPDADPEAPEYLHGNARTRLRDGTEVTIGELKKAYDEAREFRVKQADIDAKQRDFEAKQAQIAQQEQHFAQTVAQAKAILEANFPPEPDFAAYERGDIDVITLNEQQAKRASAEKKWRELNGAQQRQAQKVQQEQAEQAKQHVAREFETLKEKLPELRTDEGFKAFKTEVLDAAPKHFGFTPEEIANIVDHRALLVIKDALAYRKLQAEKAKVLAKVKEAPPVQAAPPARRVSPAERKAEGKSELFQQVRKTGSFDAALSYLNNLDT